MFDFPGRFPAIRFDAPTLLSFSGCTHAHAKCPPVHFNAVKSRKQFPGLILFKGPFWGAYFWRGLSTEENLRLKIDWALLISGSGFLALLRHMVLMVGLLVRARRRCWETPGFTPKHATAVGAWQETSTTGHPLSRSSVTRRARYGRLSISIVSSVKSNAHNPWGFLALRSLGHL